MEEIRLSVGELIHFVMRSGDIDQSFYRQEERLQQGIKIHQQIQAAYGPLYEKEVAIENQTVLDEVNFVVAGRMDGLYRNQDQVLIDEIKSTGRRLEDLREEENPLHWAQVQCYGYFYCQKHQLDHLVLRLTYYQVESQEILKIEKNWSYPDLEKFYRDLLASYLDFSRQIIAFRKLRKASIQALAFPFPKYRPGQRKLASAVYRTIAEGKDLLVEAPTGIGKTLSTIFPAIKALGEGLGDKVFYCTSKHSIQEACHKALVLLMEGGLRCKSVNLTAKEKICLNDHTTCTPQACPYARGHFDRVNACILEIYEKEDLFLREIILAYARKHRVCPGELQFDLCNYADFIIGDYNYVFDPLAYLRRFFDDVSEPYLFLVDEAHNLVTRSRAMYSKALGLGQIQDLAQALASDAQEVRLHGLLLELAQVMEKPGPRERILSAIPDKIDQLLRKISKKLEDYLADRKGEAAYDQVLAFYFDVFHWLKIADIFDSGFRYVLEQSQEGSWLKLICLDASQLLGARLAQARSAILFSATIQPLAFYGELLGLQDHYQGSLPSPFPEENLDIAIIPLSLRYKDRQANRRAYGQILKDFLATPNNALVFFPSYVFLQDLVQDLEPSGNYLVHQQDMDLQDREAYLQAFRDQRGVKGLTVLGGSFSEGIDLVGDQLEELLIFSVGLPGLGLEQRLIQAYYQAQGKRGFDYAYIYPGMNKVAQAAGRLIRSEEDRGRLVLVDSRFVQKPYPALWPRHWRKIRTLAQGNLGEFMKGKQ